MRLHEALYQFHTSEFNPRIQFLKEFRIVEITDSCVYIDGFLHWQTDDNIWYIKFRVRKAYKSIHHESWHDDLKSAVETACELAGIKSTDPQWREKMSALKDIQNSLDSLTKVRSTMGDNVEIQALEKSLKERQNEIENGMRVSESVLSSE